ncbi:MAG TPA: beta-propeller fold lactonase family protein, partial [Terriglobales bacterium]|nr:beta-propeller fold lactonase family protein [Terriglobales bacterium]
LLGESLNMRGTPMSTATSIRLSSITAVLALAFSLSSCGSSSSSSTNNPNPSASPSPSTSQPGASGGGSGSSSGSSGGSSGGSTSGSGSGSPGGGIGAGGGAPTQAQFLYGSSGAGVKGGKIDSSTGQVVSVPMPTDPATGITGFQTGTGATVFAITIDRLGRLLYTADRQGTFAGRAIGSNGIGAFTIDRGSGVLNRVSGSPYSLPDLPADIAIDGSGRFIYVSLPGIIDIWSVNQSSGALTHISSTAGGGAKLATTWDGRFLLSNAAGAVTSYSIDQGSGSLTPVSTAAVGSSDGLSLSIGNALADSWKGNTATVLSLDSNGQLAMQRQPVVLQGGNQVNYISVAADNRKAYVTIHDDTSSTGHLVRYDGIGGDQIGIFGTAVLHAEADFNSKFVYSAEGTSKIQTYVVNPNGGFGPGPTSQGPIGTVEVFRLSP